MVMSPGRGGVFDVLCALTRAGLGGSIAGGRQFVSWIHERDFMAALRAARGVRTPGSASTIRSGRQPRGISPHAGAAPAGLS
jgi:hypothetical protein